LAGESPEKGIANILLRLSDFHDAAILQLVSKKGLVEGWPGLPPHLADKTWTLSRGCSVSVTKREFLKRLTISRH
jgi:hypothetical protein